MAAADLVITGTVLTVDDTRPTAEALAVADGRIVAVGDRSEVAGFIGPNTQTVDVGDGCVMPGLIEAHGHPLMEAIALSDRLVDIRPVTMRDADEVVAATRTIGVTPGSCGHANYTAEQLTEIVGAYFPLGWPMACHVQGDAGVDTILDVYEEARRQHPRDDHRLRLEHVGAIRDEQLRRAADLGVTCSIFVDQIHYWGDVIVDGLFGEERGSRWMPAGSAVATGMRISLHNDPPVTPEEPLRNISVAVTRKAPSGRVLGPEERLTVEQAIRAQTIDAAWQPFSDDIVGSPEVGKYADLVVLSADPRSVLPEEIADLEVRATFLAGGRVYAS